MRLLWVNEQVRTDMLYLGPKDVDAAINALDPVECVGQALELHAEGKAALPAESYLAWRTPLGRDARSISMSAFLAGHPGPRIGTKIINANVSNWQQELPRAAGVTVLFDPESGRPECVMPSGAVSASRTAAVSVIALRELMINPYVVIAVIGAGPIAAAHLELLTQHFPQVGQVRVFDRDRRRATSLVGRMLKKHPGGIQFAVEASAEAAIRGSDAVIAATTVTAGYLPLAWLTRGTVVLNVSLDDVLPEVVERAQLVIVDDWELIRMDSRRLFGRLYREGRLRGPDEAVPSDRRARRVDASIGDVLLEKHPGRSDPCDIVLVNPFGMAVGDIAYADAVYRWAVTNGLGVELDL